MRLTYPTLSVTFFCIYIQYVKEGGNGLYYNDDDYFIIVSFSIKNVDYFKDVFVFHIIYTLNFVSNVDNEDDDKTRKRGVLNTYGICMVFLDVNSVNVETNRYAMGSFVDRGMDVWYGHSVDGVQVFILFLVRKDDVYNFEVYKVDNIL